MRSARPPQDRKFSCPKCEKKFFTPKDLRRHENTHLGLREHVCPSCHTRFGRKDHLTRHLKKSCSAIRNQQQQLKQPQQQHQPLKQPQHLQLKQQTHQQQQQHQHLQQHQQQHQNQNQHLHQIQHQHQQQEQEQLHQSNEAYPIPVPIQAGVGASGGGITIGPSNHLFDNNHHQSGTGVIAVHHNHHHQQNNVGNGHLLQPQHQVQFNRPTNGSSIVGNGQSIASRLGNCQHMSQWTASSIYNTMAQQQELGPGHVGSAGVESSGSGGYWQNSWMEEYQYSSTLATDYGS